MSARWITLFVWAAVAATLLFWGFKLWVKTTPVPPQAQMADNTAVARGDLTRLLGVDAPPPVATAEPEPAPDARFTLVGVVSPRARVAAREGLALIAVDGKPPKAFRVGALVDGNNVLQTVSARGVTLGPRQGAASIALNLTPPPAAATGTLPPAPDFSEPIQPRPVAPPSMPPQIQPQRVPPTPIPQNFVPPAPSVPQPGIPPMSREAASR
jgi:general secretion pathway protein C